MAEQSPREQSAFRIYSKGIVAANKPLRSSIIEVTPIEDMPMLSGEITDNAVDFEAKGKDPEGNDSVDEKIKTTATIKAEWYRLGSCNRITAPDVRRGEEVLIFQFADSDSYFWVEADDKGLRRLETITWRLSNLREEGKELDHTNSYTIHASTHEKIIELRTSKSDGEPYAYQVRLDTKKGNLIIQDDDGQSIYFDSKERHIQILNKDKSLIEMNKRVINIKSQDEVNIETRRYNLKATESLKEETRTHTYKSASFSGNTSGAYSLKAGSYSAESTFTYRGNSTFNGNNRVNGDSHITGNSFEGSSSGGNNNR
jgi:hypothetical protein